MADLVILGGGASGLMAAVSAARFIPGKNISILERGPRVGKKLLVTGNGRCNLTNLELDFSRYHGAKALFRCFPASAQRLSPVGRLGLLTGRKARAAAILTAARPRRCWTYCAGI
ncbi:MAG: NAD(P)/FAD-dependent oxidoreductase [[Clostridium] leptum]